MNGNNNFQTELPSQLNWLNWIDASDKDTASVVEYPFYSDAHITGEFTDGLGPYSFLNHAVEHGFRRTPPLIFIAFTILLVEHYSSGGKRWRKRKANKNNLLRLFL